MSRKTHWTTLELPWKREDETVPKVPQYPLPWQVKFDWKYGNDSSEVFWTCDIGYFGEVQEIMGCGSGMTQLDALVSAVENVKENKL